MIAPYERKATLRRVRPFLCGASAVALGLGYAYRDAVALQGNSRVDCIDISADDGHEVRLRRCDIDLAGRSAAGGGDVVGVAVERGMSRRLQDCQSGW